MNWAAAAAVASLSMTTPCLAASEVEPTLNKSQLLLQSVAPAASADFIIEAWADSPNGVYGVGQEVRLFLRSGRDAYHTVVAIGPEGEVLQLYPPPNEPPMLLRAGDVLTIPASNDAWTIRATYPAGRELVRIVGSTSPVAILPNGKSRIPADVAAAQLQAEIMRLPGGIAIFDLQLDTVADAPCRWIGR